MIGMLLMVYERGCFFNLLGLFIVLGPQLLAVPAISSCARDALPDHGLWITVWPIGWKKTLCKEVLPDWFEENTVQSKAGLQLSYLFYPLVGGSAPLRPAPSRPVPSRPAHCSRSGTAPLLPLGLRQAPCRAGLEQP